MREYCYAENCRYRHWRSGPVPTHIKGDDCPAVEKSPQAFILVRDEDETGISGTGKVAEGVIYSDGYVSMRWVVGNHRSTTAYDSIDAVEAIHGHGGKTRIEATK